jgi:hypothetical protein
MSKDQGPVNGANYTISYIQGCRFIKCHTCGMTSFAPNDIENRYCGNCHVFHEDPQPVPVDSEGRPQKGSKT